MHPLSPTTPPTTPSKPPVPVQATLETVTKWKSGGTSSSAKYSRDDQSRTRVEHGDMVNIHDPAKGQSFTLHPPTKTAFPGAPQAPGAPGMPSAPSAPSSGPKIPGMPQFKAPEFKETKDLGDKTIDGHAVSGKQFTAQTPGKPPMTQEVWTSKDMQLPLHSTTTDHSTGMTSVTQMKNVTPNAKHDPGMFQVPAGFKMVQPPKPPSMPK
jgi:hypothetical protein